MKEKIKEYLSRAKCFLFEQEEDDEEESLVEMLYQKKIDSIPQN